MSPESLRRRLAHGNVYPPEHLDTARANVFRPAVLGSLRHLALTWLADRVDEQVTRDLDPDRAEIHRDVSESSSPSAAKGASCCGERRLANRSSGQLIGVHVTRTDRQPGPDLERQRRLLTALGGAYRELRGTMSQRPWPPSPMSSRRRSWWSEHEPRACAPAPGVRWSTT